MKIVPSTMTAYAYVQWEPGDEGRMREGQMMALDSPRDARALKGMRIEVSKDDVVPENVRNRLIDGRFFLVD